MIRLQVNGEPQHYVGPDQALLLDVLREQWQLKGTRFGCGQNQCGACHVLIDGKALPACDTPMWSLEGKTVISIEGLQHQAIGKALTTALVREQAAQCGYCISGIAVTAAALIVANQNKPPLTDEQVRAALDGHLCRCGAHNRIVRAVLLAEQWFAHGASSEPNATVGQG